MPPTTPPITWGVFGLAEPPELIGGSAEEPEVATKAGAVSVALMVATAPAAVLREGDSGKELEVRVEKVVR